MINASNPYTFHIGQQNLKTAFATTLTAFLYFLIERNPTFACIGAIFGTGKDMGNSRLNGGNRFFGTIIGGLLGMLLFRIYIIFYPDGNPHHMLMFIFVFIGVMFLILASRLVHWLGAIQPGGVVLCIILFNTPVDTYISYSINRMIDTGVGVAIALLVSWLLPRERMHKIMHFLHLRHDHPEEQDA